MQYKSLEKFNEEIYQYIGTPDTLILHALSGISYPDPSYEMKRNKSDMFSIEYVYEGEGAIQHNKKIFKVSSGDFFILHPGTYHHYYASPNNPWKKIFFTVDGNPEYIQALLRLHRIEDIVYLPKVYNPSILEKIFDLIKNDDGNIHHKLEELVFVMFSEISDACKKLEYDSSTMSQAKRFIDKRITTKLPMSEICNYIGLNRSYFCRSFKKEFGISPSEYIINAKVEQSKYLLSNSSLNIEDIALNFSFSNKSHYIRTFIKTTGMSPNEYRKSICSVSDEGE